MDQLRLQLVSIGQSECTIRIGVNPETNKFLYKKKIPFLNGTLSLRRAPNGDVHFMFELPRTVIILREEIYNGGAGKKGA